MSLTARSNLSLNTLLYLSSRGMSLGSLAVQCKAWYRGAPHGSFAVLWLQTVWPEGRTSLLAYTRSSHLPVQRMKKLYPYCGCCLPGVYTRVFVAALYLQAFASALALHRLELTTHIGCFLVCLFVSSWDHCGWFPAAQAKFCFFPLLMLVCWGTDQFRNWCSKLSWAGAGWG